MVTFATRCAEKLRKEGSYCAEVSVFIHTNFFNKNKAQYSNAIKIKLPFSTDSNITLAKYSIQALDRIFIEGFEYKKAGVIVGNISPKPYKQMNLFENENPKHKALMQTIDYLNASLSNPIVKLGGQDFGRREKMKQERLSPRYTTHWNELLEIE